MPQFDVAPIIAKVVVPRTFSVSNGMRRFDDEIIVACPRCGERAVVFAGVRLRCPHCTMHHSRAHSRSFGSNGRSHNRASDLSDWYGETLLLPTEPSRCRKCGNDIADASCRQAADKIVASVDDALTGQCSRCGEGYRLSARWTPFHDAGGSRERFFGTQLYLRKETAKGTVWGYNREHIEALSHYIASDRRDREDGNVRALVNNLPGWIKQAKNRDLVARALARLTE